MKSNLLTIILMVLGVPFVYGQSMYMAGSPVERASPINEIKSQPRPAVGSVYLDPEWAVATLDLVKGFISVDQLKDVPMKLDLQSNTFELNSPTGIKALEGNKVEKFQIVNAQTGATEVFFNCNKFKLDGVSLVGFCKITGTNVALARYSIVKFFRADYNVTLNTGRKEDEFVKVTNLYFVKENNFYTATKKNLFALMSDKEPEIKKFIKEQRISFNKEDELGLLVEYYDSLIGEETVQ